MKIICIIKNNLNLNMILLRINLTNKIIYRLNDWFIDWNGFIISHCPKYNL